MINRYKKWVTKWVTIRESGLNVDLSRVESGLQSR